MRTGGWRRSTLGPPLGPLGSHEKWQHQCKVRRNANDGRDEGQRGECHDNACSPFIGRPETRATIQVCHANVVSLSCGAARFVAFVAPYVLAMPPGGLATPAKPVTFPTLTRRCHHGIRYVPRISAPTRPDRGRCFHRVIRASG